MPGKSQGVLGLVLMISVSLWAQSVCPMMLFPQSAEECSRPVHAAAVSQDAVHECCPGMRARVQHQECDRTKVANCVANMSCCSVERPPADTGKAVQGAVSIAVTGRTAPAAFQTLSHSATLEAANERPPDRGVLQLKEDLRI